MFKNLKKKEMYLWSLFWLLNTLYFLPRFILDINHSSFLPVDSFLNAEGGVYNRLKPIFIRENYDIFRVSYDFFLIVCSYFIIRKWMSYMKFSILVFVFFIATFLFQVYTSFFLHLYSTEPLLYNDWEAIKLGFMIVFQGVNFMFVLSLFIILIVLCLIFYLIKTLFKTIASTTISWLTKGVLIVFFVLFGFNLKYKFVQTTNHTFQSQVLLLVNNLKGSQIAAENMKLITVDKLVKSNNYDGFTKVNPPNIIFIAIESYGRVLNDHIELKNTFHNNLKKNNKSLINNGWYSVSCYSESPIHGGISWVGYSTMFYGFNIKNHATYLSLLERKNLKEYKSLFNLLKQSNYTNYKLSSIPQVGKLKIPWDKYTNFYHVSEWIKHKDLNYDGELYGFGPSPPDQYSLNFAMNKIKNKKPDQPYSLFFITQNSHNPFVVPGSLSANWRDLNTKTQKDIVDVNLLGRPELNNYRKAINYQIDMLTDLILKTGDSNDVFILVGDHQPPFITQEKDGREVPLHIVSKNEKFLKGFEKYGLSGGLLVNDRSNTIKHEGFYSMFIREVMRSYNSGNSEITLPVYLPNGVEFK